MQEEAAEDTPSDDSATPEPLRRQGLIRRWTSPKAWKKWWKNWWEPKLPEEVEVRLERFISDAALTIPAHWKTGRLSFKEARLASWVRALQDHLARCDVLEDCKEDTSAKRPEMKTVRKALARAQKDLARVREKRMVSIAKADLRRAARIARERAAKKAASEQAAIEQAQEQAAEPDEAAESPKQEEEEFELDPNLKEELKRWGEFKTGPGATSDQKGIDELTAFVAKRQAETEAAASKDRSFHNEQMTFGPLPTGKDNVGSDEPAE